MYPEGQIWNRRAVNCCRSAGFRLVSEPYEQTTGIGKGSFFRMVRDDGAETVLAVGNVTLNRATFELSSPSGSYRLANREFQMMEMLMCNPKHVISLERFMEKIWGYDSDAEISVVWVYVSYLRKKLAACLRSRQEKAAIV